jgi:tRNA 5-methylaminomethyl-2-thiouridine biosynthesis bifunctional protein
MASTPDGRWQALDAEGAVLAGGDRLVLAGGHGTRALLAGTLPLQPVRGQLVHGPMPADSERNGLPTVPLNGDGHLVPAAPMPGGPRWLSGSTFSPGDDARDLRPEDTEFNLDRLERLHPGVSALARQQAARGELQAWAGVRCASADRRPLVGPVPGAAPGLWVSTAMGSRGLSFAALCAELLAARWHGEPLPVAANLARSLDTSRVRA